MISDDAHNEETGFKKLIFIQRETTFARNYRYFSRRIQGKIRTLGFKQLQFLT